MMSIERAVNIVEKNIVGTYAMDEHGKSQFMCDEDDVAWQTLKAHCTQPTDVQQLKQAIALVRHSTDLLPVNYNDFYFKRGLDFIEQRACV